MNNQIFIIGVGKLGAKIAKNLSDKGENVMVLDKNKDSFKKLDDFSGFTKVGDASDLSVLNDVNMNNFKTVIITTDDDNMNLFLSDVFFTIYDITNIFVRLSDSNKAKLIKNDCIHPICPFLLSLDKFEEIYEKGDGILK